MKALVITLVLLLVPALVAVPTANADAIKGLMKLPPEYLGGYCGWHWHSTVDLAEGEYPHYHYHHCI